MPVCPNCGMQVSTFPAAVATPAFPKDCSNCGVAFHCKFTLFGIFVSALGLVVGLAAIVLTGHPWIGMVVVLGAILWLAVLASKSQLVVSTPDAVRRWRLAIGALLVLYVVIEMLPMFVSH